MNETFSPSFFPRQAAVVLTLTMVVRTAAIGKMAKRTVTACARVPRAKGSTPASGPTDSKCKACTRGPVATITKVNGWAGSGTDWA